MQASLRPFAVRSFLWAKASRCTRITPLTGRLGTRNFAVPPGSDPGIPSSPESALSSQPTGSWDESAERKGKYCGFAPLVEFIPLPAQPSVPDNENPPPSTRFTGKKENLQRQAELSPLDDIIPHLDRQSSGTEGEHASDDTPEGKSGSDGTPPTTTTKEARKARAKAKRKEKKLQSKEALKTQSPPPSIAKEVSFGRLSSWTESGHTSNSTPNEPESQNGSYGTPPITNQKEEERETKRLLKKAKSKEKKSQRKNLKEAMKTESPATRALGGLDPTVVEDLDVTPTLAGPPPRLVFGHLLEKNTVLTPPPHVKSRLQLTSVALAELPPFVTLSDVGRIALRAGAAPGDVVGIQFWTVGRKRVQSRIARTEDDHKNGAESEDGHPGAGSWHLGATIHFRDTKTARDFVRAPPLLLEVHPPDVSQHTSAVRPQVRVFPPAEDAEAWTPTRLAQFALGVRTWSETDIPAFSPPQTAPNNRHADEAAESVAIEETATKAEDSELQSDSTQEGKDAEVEQGVRERAQVLTSMWSRLETPLDESVDTQRGVAAMGNEQGDRMEAGWTTSQHDVVGSDTDVEGTEKQETSLEAPQVSAADALPSADADEREGLTEETDQSINVKHVTVMADSTPTEEGAQRAKERGFLAKKEEKKQQKKLRNAAKRERESDDVHTQSTETRLPPAGTVVSVPINYVPTPDSDARWISLAWPTTTRWLALRVPGSGVPIFAPDSAITGAGPIADAPATEEPEHEDPTVQLYALSLRKALARERELERDLRAMRAAAQERELEAARTAAEAQVRADFGSFGALEGVWVRGVRVPALAPPAAAAPKDVIGVDVGGEGKAWVYEMHALVAFADAQAAGRARTVLPVQVPAYMNAGVHFVSTPWREALGGLQPEEVLEMPGGAREGWARRLAREHRAEALAREREKERERQRGAAEGTWGKERLTEIRERLRRAQHRLEWERQREEAWARAREREIARLEVATAAATADATPSDAAADTSSDFKSDTATSFYDSESDSETTSASSSESSESASQSDSDSDSESNSDSDSESNSDSDSESDSDSADGEVRDAESTSEGEPEPALPYVARF